MQTWQIRLAQRNYVVSEDEITIIKQLINSVQGTVVTEELQWDGRYAIRIDGILSTNSLHVAERVATLIHSIGGRARLRKIDSRKLTGYVFHPVTHREKTGNRHHAMTR